MRYPEKLKKGDTVGLVCTSSPIKTERIEKCREAVENLGFKVKMADNLDAKFNGYMAGSGRERAKWLNTMFEDPEVKGIFCIRGGDGSSRIMEYLDYEMIKNNPKVFAGYSDVTNLHLAFNKKCDFVTYHGPMVSSNMADGFDNESERAFIEAVCSEEPYEFKNPEGYIIGVINEGHAEGRITGGNLSLLSASIGTPYEIDTRDSILFIEEVGEPMSKIEKWIYHLRNTGKFNDCKGVILGQFTNVTNEECPDLDADEYIGNILKEYNIPVMCNIQSGHGDKMITMPMGAECIMDTASLKISFK